MIKIIVINEKDLKDIVRSEVERAVNSAIIEYANAQKKSASEKKYLNRLEVAEFLGISLSTLHRIVANGYLPCRKIGRKSCYLRSDVEKVILTLNK